ncbi:MAG: hypothetical protein V4857_09880 [Pseudomonadota bacterium]
MNSNLISDCFGPRFDALHALPQLLHRRGGSLRGPVEVRERRFNNGDKFTSIFAPVGRLPDGY